MIETSFFPGFCNLVIFIIWPSPQATSNGLSDNIVPAGLSVFLLNNSQEITFIGLELIFVEHNGNGLNALTVL